MHQTTAKKDTRLTLNIGLPTIGRGHGFTPKGGGKHRDRRPGRQARTTQRVALRGDHS